VHDEARTACECWTRVMGYFRPISAWNPGKQGEHRERRRFRLPSDLRDPIQPGCACLSGAAHINGIAV
jgi:hypothetical protein